ncbi:MULTISPECIES: hypothetical protein [Clostridium]|uniref:hypothetical protein n=1 Tax=Clostridium TaxID=1485 RepID=UPI000826C8A9|nr:MULTISPECIES: hypothetical protein [Clostridium]PJI09078.1 hypothetical protein CUB90_14905 [Clostridium sp. CT7]
MEDRAILRAYNDVIVSEEEIKKYETTKLSDDVLSKMKKKTKMLYKRVNMEESFEKVEEQFEDGEKVKYVFWEPTYMIREYQAMCGGWAATAGAMWTSWPTKTGVILTNKGIFGIEVNDAYEALKIKHFSFNEVDYIESRNLDKITVIFTIKPVRGEEIKLEICGSDNYIKFLDCIKKNNIKLDIRVRRYGRKEKINMFIWTIILVLIILLGLILPIESSFCKK